MYRNFSIQGMINHRGRAASVIYQRPLVFSSGLKGSNIVSASSDPRILRIIWVKEGEHEKRGVGASTARSQGVDVSPIH